MKKLIFLVTLAILTASTLSAQRISKKAAREILEKCLGSLKTGDTATFVSLWQLNDSPWPFHEQPFTRGDLIPTFIQMKQFLDTALRENMPFDEFAIERPDSAIVARYTIRVWFKYNPHYYKGFGLHVDYINDKWVCRFYPDTSYMIRSGKN